MTFDLMVKFCGRQQLVPKYPSYVCLIGRRKGCYVLHWLASVKRVVVLDFSKCTFTSDIVWRQIVQTLISFEFQNIIFFSSQRRSQITWCHCIAQNTLKDSIYTCIYVCLFLEWTDTRWQIQAPLTELHFTSVVE